MKAPELFAEPAAAEGQGVLAQESGAKFLVRRILEEYTTDRQDLQWEVLTALFGIFRGNIKFGDFLSLYDMALSDAEAQCGTADEWYWQDLLSSSRRSAHRATAL
eukprot:4689431-Pyramimonas_sp.AAC.1